MAVAPLLETKLHIPARRPDTVPRQRLAERLERVRESRLTLVSAPAGFGKTTLLTQWLAETADPTASSSPAAAWVSLDERDNDAVTFWTYVVTAVSRTLGSASPVGAAALSLLGSPPSIEAAMTTLLNDLQRLTSDIVLVLDDYHVITARDVHDGLTYLLDNLPPTAHLVLATRADPPLPLPRLRSRGEIVEVRSADLRFTPDEAAAFLAGPMRLALSAEDAATLADRTEGWAAALQLAGLSLQDRDNPSALVATFAGDDRFVVDYLGDEVLARQTDDVREFLLATSVLDRLCGPLCDAVTGQTGGAAQLVELERANLFVVPLDERRQWYRYHHLFADVLRSHLGEQHPDRIAELHRKAAQWLDADGDSAEAIRHALAGEDFEHAAELMELAMPAMRRERREGDLAHWVRALPDAVVRTRPVLAVAFVGALAQVSDFDTVAQRLADVDGMLRPDGGPWPDQPPAGLVIVDHDGYRSLPANVAMYRAALALADGDLVGTVGQARQALSLAPSDDYLVGAGAGALAGLASWAMGDLEAAHAAYTESIGGLRRAGHVVDVLGLCITLGDLLRTQGRLGDALHIYREALDGAAPQPGTAPPRGTADMHTGIAEVLLERDDLAGAVRQLAAGQRLGEHSGLPQNTYRRRVVTARLREAEGDLDAALELLDEANRVYASDYSPNVRPVPAVRARLRIRKGELAEAEAWVRERGLSAGDELSYLREYEHVTLARVLLARHETNRNEAGLEVATGLLERLLAAAEAGGRDGIAIEILVLQALARHAQGDPSAALAALHRAVSLAQPERYVRVFADEGPSMSTLLRALAKQDVSRADASYIRRLVAAASKAEHAAPAGQGGLVEPLSDRELDVLRLLASDLNGPDIARTLHVSLNTLRTHSRNIFRKLGVTSRRSAVRQAAELDLLPKPRGA